VATATEHPDWLTCGGGRLELGCFGDGLCMGCWMPGPSPAHAWATVVSALQIHSTFFVIFDHLFYSNFSNESPRRTFLKYKKTKRMSDHKINIIFDSQKN
jgi:hypothetical protein